MLVHLGSMGLMPDIAGTQSGLPGTAYSIQYQITSDD